MSEKIRLCLRLKSGKEFCFSCDKYTITKSNVTGELLEFTYEGGFGECPSYFGLNDVESISRINVEEPKTGKWIPQDHNKTNGMASTLVYYYPKCSVCGHCDNYTNFCSNCGADMRGENHE